MQSLAQLRFPSTLEDGNDDAVTTPPPPPESSSRGEQQAATIKGTNRDDKGRGARVLGRGPPRPRGRNILLYLWAMLRGDSLRWFITSCGLAPPRC